MARCTMRNFKKTQPISTVSSRLWRSRNTRRSRVLLEALEQRIVMSVFTVTTLADSGVGSLRAAISATSNGDTIDFASSLSGIVDLTTAGDSSAGPAAFGITDSITIDGSASPSGITIERDNSASDMRLFNIASGASLTLVNVTLANGIAQGGDGGDGYWSGGAGAGLGGAIFNQGTLTIKGSTFDSNQAVGGAAVAYNDNPGGGGGGGLDGTPADSDASNGFGAAGAGPNGGAGGTASAAGAAGGFGGGGGGGAGFNLNASDQAAGNGGFGGGGGAAGDGSDSDSGANGGFGGGGGGGGDFPSVNDGSGGFGGGNAMFGVGGAGGGMGGAVFNDAGTVVISNSTFTANSAVGGAGTSGSGNGDGYGGAIFNLDGSTTVTNATLSSNTAAQGGTDIYNLANGVVASVAANNSIMGQTSNSVTDFVDDSEGASASSSGVGDLIRSTTTFSGTNVSASDPLLGALANNGGLTDTLLPGAGSPAIDAGNNTAASGLSTDQRGDTRIINSVVDIGSVEVQSSTVAPTITSVTTSTFTVGSTGAFTVTTTGTPTAALSEIGSLPGGVNFTDNGNGTATITGIPAAASGADYDLTITAANGVTPNAQQSFTLVVDQAPAITSATAATFTVGTSASFTVTSTGFPTAAMTESGAFPAGLNWTDNGNGTGTISGIPNPGTGADLSVTMNASNGVSPDVHQPFTLIVDQAPAITSAASDSIAAGSSASFTVTTTGFPAAAISELGSVPTGMTFTDNGDGTATLAGTAAATATGVYTLTLGANNGTAPAASQTFTLTVDGAPSIISAASTTFTAGTSGTFAVHATGFPTAAIAEIGHLPTGVTLTDNGNGTATLGGTPADGTGGSYPITIQAANGTTPDFDQSFTLTVATPPPVVVAANVNGQEVLDVNNPDGTTRFTITPFPNAAYTQLNVALADQNGSGIDDIIVGAGPGGAPRVKIYNSQTGVKVAGFLAFGSNFHGGVNVAAGDVNDDGISDIIVGKGSGGPRVRVFNGSNLALMDNFLAFTVPGYTGGVRVAAADLNGDGHADVVAATGPGTRADVAIYDGAALASDTASETTTFYAFGTIFDGGAYVATGDVNGDGTPDIIVSKGPGGGPRVKVFSGTDDSLIQNFLVYSSSQTNGITVAAGNTNGDADADIITATGPGIAGQVRVYNGVDDSILQQYNIGNTDGLWVADAEL